MEYRGNRDIFWWLHDKGEEDKILASLNDDFTAVIEDNNRIAAYDTYASLYNNRRIDSTGGILSKYNENRWAVDQQKYTRCPYNLMKQVIDEVTSRITKTHPTARFLTHGGDAEMQRKAELMQRWSDSQVYQLHQSEVFESVIKDACVYGLGALKITKAYKEDRIASKRVYPGNLYVDLQETIFDEPTRLHHRRFVHKNALKMFFPKMEEKIDNAGLVSDDSEYISRWGDYGAGNKDMLELVESWHLPSFKGSADGRRYLWINNAILQSSPYERRSFPFAFFTWKTDPSNTFYGVGLGEDLLGVHIDANVTLNRVNKAIEFASVPYWSYRKGSVSETDIANVQGIKVPWTGDFPPQFVVPSSVPQDLLQYVREHEARAYKIAGLASAQAFGERVPSGLETGRAVENYFNVESVPFATQLRKFEYFVEDVVNANVSVGKEIAEGNPKWSVVTVTEQNTIEVLDWKEVSLDPREDSYVIRAAPASALSELPAARLGEVERLMMILPSLTEEDRARMLAMPDIANRMDLFSAQKDNGQAMIVEALRKGTYTAPSPFMNLQQFIIDANQAEQRAERMGISEFNLSVLRRMIRRANELKQKQMLAQQMAAQGAIMPAVVPVGGTGQTPTEANPQAQTTQAR